MHPYFELFAVCMMPIVITECKFVVIYRYLDTYTYAIAMHVYVVR